MPVRREPDGVEGGGPDGEDGAVGQAFQPDSTNDRESNAMGDSLKRLSYDSQ